ncbi:ABC transporter permease subunit [Leeia sp. TBRC 13508]|uniref:ABC transporter permease subunit n=1 Tax=Leeia speluncae TaxID=2884804 RepID=A0ABS8DA84_9NEIS|nr:ABC transporter permease subunit [Leeia speluncae]MCB6185123.1 ABC transporter permease subunit [Leeia speluncae]
MVDVIPIFDQVIEESLSWLTDNAGDVFNGISAVLNGSFNLLNHVFQGFNWMVFILVIGIYGFFFVSRIFGVVASLGLWLCQAMGLWSETMTTLTLVISSTFLALLFAIPLGILLGLTTKFIRWADVVLDFIQTMPPYIYLLPGIALLGFGPATAMWATWLVAIPPALRLTAHGISITPIQFNELGTSIGLTGISHLFKIRVPFAVPSIFAGINQSLMLSFSMVVIAGIAGSGGLGQVIYDSVRSLQIDKAVDAGLAIVVVTIVLDRITQRFGMKERSK